MSDRGRSEPTAKPPKLVTLTVHALIVALFALFVALDAWFPELFVKRSTARLGYINRQGDDVIWWALSTALAAPLLRFRPRRSLPVVAIWTVALLNTRPWGWPPPPIDFRDLERLPYWRSWPLPTLSSLSVLLGLRVAWRETRQIRLAASVFAFAIAVILVGSAVVIRAAERAEQPVPTDHGRVTLQELEADPLWNAVGRSSLIDKRSETGSLTPWGEETASEISQQVPGDDRAATFDRVLEAALQAGWEPTAIYCSAAGNSRTAVLEKRLPSSPANVWIEENGTISSVRIRTQAEDVEVRESDTCP